MKTIKDDSKDQEETDLLYVANIPLTMSIDKETLDKLREASEKLGPALKR